MKSGFAACATSLRLSFLCDLCAKNLVLNTRWDQNAIDTASPTVRPLAMGEKVPAAGRGS